MNLRHCAWRGCLALLVFAALEAGANAATHSQVCHSQSWAPLVSDLTATLIAATKPSYWSPPLGILAAVAFYDPFVETNLTGVPSTYVKASGSNFLAPLTTPRAVHKWALDPAVPTNQLQDSDLGRVGSCTKSFTATIMAMLISQRKQYKAAGSLVWKTLQWNTTLNDLFPTYKYNTSSMRAINIRNILNHQAGFDNYPQYTVSGATLRAQRQSYTQQLLAAQLKTGIATGSMFYSNAGYIVASHIIEFVANATWEDLVRNWIFTPLGLSSGGFGPIGKNGWNNVTYGHFQGYKTNASYIAYYGQTNGWDAPVGDIHLTAADHSKWAIWHLRMASPTSPAPITCPTGASWLPPCITRFDFAQLHAKPPVPVGGSSSYAMGWLPGSPAWTPSAATVNTTGGQWHNGAVWGWYSEQWYLPAMNMALTVITNHHRRNHTDNSTIMPVDLVTDMLRAISTKYRLPTCPSSTPTFNNFTYALPSPLGSSTCAAASNFTHQARCRANPNYVSSSYSISDVVKTYNYYQDCTYWCVKTANCLAWSFRAASPEGSRCYWVLQYTRMGRRSLADGAGAEGGQQAGADAAEAVEGAAVRRGLPERRLLQTGNASDPVDCTGAAEGYVTGLVRRYSMPFLTQRGLGGAVPYNNANQGAPCLNSSVDCMKLCLQSYSPAAGGPTRCTGWSYNASLRKCFLFNGTVSLRSEPYAPHCVLTSGTVSPCPGALVG
ncbi:hypothetical protein HYH03_007034 [Edaphochlamys debaryana]|uniref:Beta-lactamase-related domain-containing protein n=1 Tax=Edaphochlamys debaryana TaxID=47281 RepID=A0A835Y2L5_9CHLO|nr:hypothetical protein HYH03_007034 [Edaphochlamys debaryana]|eukprot:KAG2494791.1 hypothetical protein HYH03_007034 [Edaphochlamys debaryana]